MIDKKRATKHLEVNEKAWRAVRYMFGAQSNKAPQYEMVSDIILNELESRYPGAMSIIESQDGSK